VDHPPACLLSLFLSSGAGVSNFSVFFSRSFGAGSFFSNFSVFRCSEFSSLFSAGALGLFGNGDVDCNTSFVGTGEGLGAGLGVDFGGFALVGLGVGSVAGAFFFPDPFLIAEFSPLGRSVFVSSIRVSTSKLADPDKLARSSARIGEGVGIGPMFGCRLITLGVGAGDCFDQYSQSVTPIYHSMYSFCAVL
jgi:hypothetical protein